MKTVTTPWSSPSTEHAFTVHDPSTGTPIAYVHGASPETMDAAIKKADDTWRNTWRHVSPKNRGKLLLECSRVIKEHADEIARIEAQEVGKPYTQARMFDVEFCINAFEMFGGLVFDLPSRVQEEGPLLDISTLVPYGVVGGIIPFNWPPIHTAGKTAPALAAGNCIVLKPPEQCPFAIMKIVELCNQVLPEGVLTVVPGLGAAGAALAQNPLIKMISFTGAPSTGISVLKAAAGHLCPTCMELGGKNAIIIFADADIEAAAKNAVEGAFFNQGEACTAASRILVHSSLYDRLTEMMEKAVVKLVLGDPQDERTHVGPVVTQAQRKRILDYIDIGVAEGAKILVQGELPVDERLRDGYWVRPTVFTNVEPDMRIAREEIFGPVTAIIKFDTYEEAISIANGTDFGLVAGVFSRDFTTCWRAGRDLDAGVILANNYHRSFLGTAFGGCKNSGYGREHTLETLRLFGQTKTLRIPTGSQEPPHWFAVDEIF